MRRMLLLLAGAFIFSAIIALIGQTTEIGAIGAPTDNSTIPNVPTGDQFTEEIRPPVKYTLLGPSSQSKSSPPNFNPRFIGALEEDKFKITANENWYLDVDINTPGWLYIYEYYPEGGDERGRWIAYKWQLPESGLWRLGPFTPENNEPEGQHIYRIWFYSDGQWAEGDPNLQQSNLVYWTYSKGLPFEQATEQIPPRPVTAPPEKNTFVVQLHRFITKPIVLVFSPLLIVFIVICSLYWSKAYVRWSGSQGKVSLPPEAEPEELSVALLSDVISAKIVLPNGIELQLAGNSRVIGRSDLARTLGLDELGLISRRHFEIKAVEEQFYIEDLCSANGTELNGEDIRGKGPVTLNNDDVIEPAGAIRLKFHIL